MLSDNLRQNLREGGVVSGVTMPLNAPELVEISGFIGFDFVFIDSEHGPLTIRELQTLVTAADAAGICSLVRVTSNDPRTILRVMDIGASGIIVPDVESREQAIQAIEAVKYVPQGHRGLSTTRSAWYGQKMPVGDYTKYANEKSVVICQIESKKGVENVEEILSVDLLDGIFIGTTDLSNSMGVAGQAGGKLVTDAVDSVVKKAKAAGKPFGGMVRAGESPRQYVDEGYQIVVGSGNGFFTGSAKQFVKAFKGEPK